MSNITKFFIFLVVFAIIALAVYSTMSDIPSPLTPITVPIERPAQ